MSSVAKLLVMLGVIFIIVGLLWQIGGKWLNLGKLPGDIVVKKENFTFYFPIVTCILISLALSLVFYLFRFFR